MDGIYRLAESKGFLVAFSQGCFVTAGSNLEYVAKKKKHGHVTSLEVCAGVSVFTTHTLLVHIYLHMCGACLG